MTQSGPPGAPPPPPSTPPPPPPPPPDWQSTPQQPSAAPPPPAAGSGMPAWTANITSQAPVAGPAGYFYADVPNRSIAMVIDVIAMIVVFVIIGLITTAIFGISTVVGSIPTTTSLLLQAVVSYAIWAAYFIYTWVAMRGTPGMKLLGMQIGHEADGRTITYNQAAIRFGVLFGPGIVLGLIGSFSPGLSVLGFIGLLWLIVVLITMAQSPTKQGLHDKYAQTMVVKAARSVA